MEETQTDTDQTEIVDHTQVMLPDELNDNIEAVEGSSGNRFSKFIKDYIKSYKIGVERFGVWWKVFQLSIWSIILIFIVLASIIFIVFLPKIDMINWILR